MAIQKRLNLFSITKILMRFLLVLLIALIAYGSLYPFNMDFNVLRQRSLFEILWQGSLGPQSIGDIFGNIALFLPFGALIAITYREYAGKIFLSIFCGISFAAVLQILQCFIPLRNPNLLDILWNSAGIGIGVLFGHWFGKYQNPNQPTHFVIHVEWLLIASWLSFQVIPFIPTLDPGLIWNNLKKLFPPFHLSVTSFLSHLTGWLIVGFLLQRTLPKLKIDSLFSALLLTLFIKLCLVDVSITISAYIAGIIAFITWQLGFKDLKNKRVVLMVLLFITILVNGIVPIKISPYPQGFNWIPFYGFLTGSMLINTQNLLEKIFFYGALLWLIPERKKYIFTISAFLLISTIEFLQIFSSDHTAEITDPLLILMLAAAIRIEADKNFPITPRHSPRRDLVENHSPSLFLSLKERAYIMPFISVIFIAIALRIFLKLPQIPYNLQELFLDGGSWFRLFLFSFFLLWFSLSGPLISKISATFSFNATFLFPVTLVACAISFFLLKHSVSYESISDILGSHTLRKSITNEQLWGSFGTALLAFPNAIDSVERYVRFIALVAPVTISMSYWMTFRRILNSATASRIPLLSHLILLTFIFFISKLIVIDFAATDNLTELIAKHGLFFIFPLLLLITANANYLARKPFLHQIKGISNYLFSVIGIIAGWYLLNLGLVENIQKYGFDYSGVDFLLGPDRKTLLSPTALFARWSVVYTALILILAFGCRVAEQISFIPLKHQFTTNQNQLSLITKFAVAWEKLTSIRFQPAMIGVVVIIGIVALFSISGLKPKVESIDTQEITQLPLPSSLPVADIPHFRLAHPRLPAPENEQIELIKKRNPDFLRIARSLGKHGKGKLYQAILTATIAPNPRELDNIYHQLIALRFQGRGNVEAAPLALGYDWLYRYWSEPQRLALQQKLAEGCNYLIKFISEERLSPYNVFLYNAPFQALMATAIVLYKDHPDGQICMNFAYDLWKNRVIPVWRQVMGKHGGWHEGGEYVGIGIGQAIYKVPAMWRKATGEDIFRSIPGIKGFLDFLVYRTRPDGTHMRWGDGRYFDKAIPDRYALAMEFNHKAAYSLGKCPPLFKPSAKPWGPLTTARLCDSQAIRKLPLSKLFDGIGMVISRSSWEKDATYVTFKAGDNYWSHSHLDQGSFTLYKGGPLIMDSGLYTANYNSDHHMNYSYQTIAHNVITVTDYSDVIPAPGKNKKPPRFIANDGGQRRIGSGWGVESAPLDINEWLKKKDIYHTGDIARYFTDDNVTIAIANLTPAYTNQKSGSGTFSDRSRRVENYWRTFVYDRTFDVVVIYDYLTATDETFTKRSIFHTQNRPYLKYNTIISQVFSTNNPDQSGGTLEATVLFPEKAFINIIGGEGAEFLIFNKNYDENGIIWKQVNKRKINPPEPGSWRVEIIPPVAQKTDRFLTIYNPKLINEDKTLIIKPIKTQNQIGCRITKNSRTHDFLFADKQHRVTIELNNGEKPKSIKLFVSENFNQIRR